MDGADDKQPKPLIDAFESYEWLLYQKLREADHLIGLMFKDASTFGVKTHVSQPFLQTKFYDMMEQIAEQRDVRTVVG